MNKLLELSNKGDIFHYDSSRDLYNGPTGEEPNRLTRVPSEIWCTDQSINKTAPRLIPEWNEM